MRLTIKVFLKICCKNDEKNLTSTHYCTGNQAANQVTKPHVTEPERSLRFLKIKPLFQ